MLYPIGWAHNQKVTRMGCYEYIKYYLYNKNAYYIG